MNAVFVGIFKLSTSIPFGLGSNHFATCCCEVPGVVLFADDVWCGLLNKIFEGSAFGDAERLVGGNIATTQEHSHQLATDFLFGESNARFKLLL